MKFHFMNSHTMSGFIGMDKMLRLEKFGLSPSPNGESISFSYTIIHKIYILSDSTKETHTFMHSLNHVNISRIIGFLSILL